jgi:hypothetical protein
MCALQVALLVYLAHVGSFVPAQRAVVGLHDRILAHLPCCLFRSFPGLALQVALLMYLAHVGSASSSDQLPNRIFTRLPCCMFLWPLLALRYTGCPQEWVPKSCTPCCH